MLVPRTILAARKCSDRDSARYALGGIHFTRDTDGAPLAVATDGRRLVALSWVEPAAQPGEPEHPAAAELDLSPRLTPADGFTLPLAACDQLDKCKIGAKARRDALRHFALEEPADAKANTVRIAAHDGEQAANFTPRLQEGRFPRWRDCFPDVTDGASVQLNARYLIGVLETIAAHCTDGAGDCQIVLSLTSEDPHRRAVTITAALANGNRAAAVLMPFGDGKTPPALAWEINARPAAAEAAPEQAAPEAEQAAAPEPEAEPVEPAPVVDVPADDDTDLEPAAAIDTAIEPEAEPAPEPEPAIDEPAPAPRSRRRRSLAAAAAGDAWEAGNY